MVCIGAVALLPSVAGNYNETKFQQLRQDLNDTQNEVKELKQQMASIPCGSQDRWPESAHLSLPACLH